jgi:hypothetical protein
MSKRIDPEVKIVQLFDGLSDDGKRIVLGLLKTKVVPTMRTAPKKRKTAAERTANKARTELADKVRAKHAGAGASGGSEPADGGSDENRNS